MHEMVCVLVVTCLWNRRRLHFGEEVREEVRERVAVRDPVRDRVTDRVRDWVRDHDRVTLWDAVSDMVAVNVRGVIVTLMVGEALNVPVNLTPSTEIAESSPMGPSPRDPAPTIMHRASIEEGNVGSQKGRDVFNMRSLYGILRKPVGKSKRRRNNDGRIAQSFTRQHMHTIQLTDHEC